MKRYPDHKASKAGFQLFLFFICLKRKKSTKKDKKLEIGIGTQKFTSTE